MSRFPCFGKYNDQKIRCKWICKGISQVLWVYAVEEPCEKCKRETRRREQSQLELLQSQLELLNERELKELVLSLGESRRDPLGDRDVQDCFGLYEDNLACTYCKIKTDCFQLSYGAASCSALAPTGSSFSDTGATQTEGGSDVNSKDLATRTEKAQELEVVSVGNDFMVKSSKRQGGYMVTAKEEGGHHCACMDYATHRSDEDWTCKHIIAVEMYIENRGATNSGSRYDIIDLN